MDNVKPCSRWLLISCDLIWTRMNRFKPESLKLALVIPPNVPMIDMLFLCCLSACCVENVYFFFHQTTVHLPPNNKTLKSFVIFIIRDQWHWSFLKHHWLLFFMCINIIQLAFCWFKECIFSFNVTPTLVINNVVFLFMYKCQTYFCVQYIVTLNLLARAFNSFC